MIITPDGGYLDNHSVMIEKNAILILLMPQPRPPSSHHSTPLSSFSNSKLSFLNPSMTEQFFIDFLPPIPLPRPHSSHPPAPPSFFQSLYPAILQLAPLFGAGRSDRINLKLKITYFLSIFKKE